MGGLVKTVLQT